MLLREGHSPRLAASLHILLPGVPWARQHMSCAAVQRVRSSLTRGRCSPDLGGGCPAESLRADPAYAKDLCCDFGQIIPRVAGHSRPENSRAGSTPYPCDAACPVKSTQMSLPLASKQLAGVLFPGRMRLPVVPRLPGRPDPHPSRVHCPPPALSQPGASRLQPQR